MPDTHVHDLGPRPLAILDSAHEGDITGALGTIAAADTRPRRGWAARLRTLAAIAGPGLIVMVGDNDAGAFATYTQAGQNYGTALLWTLVLLIPVLYVNQEMVLRLGAVTGVGHARLILERFGRFWGAFSVIDLLVLNGLTIVTEFIGISFGLDYLGVPKLWGVLAAAAVIMLAPLTGSFRRFERFALLLCLGSLAFVPILFMVDLPLGEMARDLVVPRLPASDKLSDVLLLVCAIVGTTIAPWQLFFQQGYVIDKRVTPRFMAYGKAELWVGIGVAVAGAVVLMTLGAAVFDGRAEAGSFTDAGGVLAGLAKYVGPVAGTLFAVALIDASIIGACAVSLASAYAMGDVLSIRHSLHRGATDARGFYLAYCGLVALSAALVLVPGVPLGLITEAVQILAGVLLPSATVFLLLLCNDAAVLGPWTNGRGTNVFAGAVVVALVLLSVVLTASVLFPEITGRQILLVLVGGGVAALVAAVAAFAMSGALSVRGAPARDLAARPTWRMPRLDQLAPARLSVMTRFWMLALRLYLVLAILLVVVRVVQMAMGQ